MCYYAKEGDVWLMSIMGFDVIYNSIEHAHVLHYDVKPFMGVHDVKSNVNVNMHDGVQYMI